MISVTRIFRGLLITFCGSCAVFYLGFGAQEHRKKYCNKIKQIIYRKAYCNIFSCRNFIRASKLIHLLSSPNKTLRKAAVMCCFFHANFFSIALRSCSRIYSLSFLYRGLKVSLSVAIMSIPLSSYIWKINFRSKFKK